MIKRKSKGFTLIELIAIIAVLGILVLLATPKLLGYTEKARITQIINDIKVHENFIEVKKADDSHYIDKWGAISSADLNTLKSSSKAYDKRGRLEETYQFKEDQYFAIPNKTVNTKLKGMFVLAKGGKVYYFDSPGVKVEIENFDRQDCSEAEAEGYICIYTVEDLINVNNDMNAKYILMNDLDLGGIENWEAIGKNGEKEYYDEQFSGVFNGNGHTIKNLKTKIHLSDEEDWTDGSNQGLFASAYEAEFKNLIVKDFSIELTGDPVGPDNSFGYYAMSIGTVAGDAEKSTFDNIVVQNYKSTADHEKIWVEFSGGVTGISWNSKFNNIKFTNIDIEASDFIGGITGLSDKGGEFRNISGDVKLKGNEFVAGMLGSADGKVIVDNANINVDIYPIRFTEGGDDAEAMFFAGLIANLRFEQKTDLIDIKNVNVSGKIVGTHDLSGLLGDVQDGSRSNMTFEEKKNITFNFNLENVISTVDIYKYVEFEEYYTVGGIAGEFEIEEHDYSKDSYSIKAGFVVNMKNVHYKGKIHDVTSKMAEDYDIWPFVSYPLEEDKSKFFTVENISWDKTKNSIFIDHDYFKLD